MIDLEMLDFSDAVKATLIADEEWLTEEDHRILTIPNAKYDIKYLLARKMADRIAKHMVLKEEQIEGKWLCIGEVTVIEKK